MTRLLIADDHPLYRLALSQAVRGVMQDVTGVFAEEKAEQDRFFEMIRRR